MAHSSNELRGTTGLLQILPGEEIEQQALQPAAAGSGAAVKPQRQRQSAVAPAIVGAI